MPIFMNDVNNFLEKLGGLQIARFDSFEYLKWLKDYVFLINVMKKCLPDMTDRVLCFVFCV